EPPWAAELWRWEVLPGESFGGDAHAPATRELAWVEEGTLTLTVAGVRHQVGPGQCARIPGSLPHSHAHEWPGAVPLTLLVLGLREAVAGRIERRLGLLHLGLGIVKRLLGRGQPAAQFRLLPDGLTAGPGPVHHETIMPREAMTRPNTLAVPRTLVLAYPHDQ